MVVVIEILLVIFSIGIICGIAIPGDIIIFTFSYVLN